MESSEDEQETKVSLRSPCKAKSNLQMVKVDTNKYEVWASATDEAEIEASGKDQLEDEKDVASEEEEQVPTGGKVRGQDDSDEEKDNARKGKARDALNKPKSNKPKSKVTASTLDDTDPIPEGYFETTWITMSDPINL